MKNKAKYVFKLMGAEKGVDYNWYYVRVAHRIELSSVLKFSNNRYERLKAEARH